MNCGILFNRHKWAKWSDPVNGVYANHPGAVGYFAVAQMRICEKCGLAEFRILPKLRRISELRSEK